MPLYSDFYNLHDIDEVLLVGKSEALALETGQGVLTLLPAEVAGDPKDIRRPACQLSFLWPVWADL